MILALIAFRDARSAEDKANPPADEAAIRAAVQSYVEVYNRGDAKAVAAHWDEAAEWISPSGTRIRGRAAIEKEVAALFAENKGLRIEVTNPSIRIVSPDVALEEGTVRVFHPTRPPSESTYLAVHVKKGGKWLLDSVRETEIPETAPADSPLRELAWLVGEWIDQSPEATVEASVTWTKNKAFLTYAFKVSSPGMDDLEGTQVIGWDPAAGTIRSWLFDSDGGFGEGVWSKRDNSWVVKFNQVLPDGSKASATNVYTPIDANAFTWKSVGRQVNGEFQPNLDDVRIVRKTPGEASAQTPKPSERPRARGKKN